MISIPIKARGFFVPQAAHEFITLLDVEQQKRIFIILAFAIYKEISKKDWYPITFVHKEGKLVSMCGDGKHLFYFYPSDNKEEMLFIQRILKIILSLKTEEQVRGKLLFFTKGVPEEQLVTMIEELFAHHSVNFVFPWNINFNKVSSKTKQLVIEGGVQKDLVEIVKITKEFAAETTVIITEPRTKREKGVYFS